MWPLLSLNTNTLRAHSTAPRPVSLKKRCSYHASEVGQTPTLQSSPQHRLVRSSGKHLSNIFLTVSARNCCQLPRYRPQLCQEGIQQHVESASASRGSQMGSLTAEPLSASWPPEEESSQTNTQRRLRRWNEKLSANFSRVFSSLAAKISNIFLPSWLVFSAAVSNACLQSTLSLCTLFFVYIYFFPFMHVRIWALKPKA